MADATNPGGGGGLQDGDDFDGQGTSDFSSLQSVTTEDADVTNRVLKEKPQSLSGGTQIENLTWSNKNRWHETLPQRQHERNLIELHTTNFYGELFGSQTNYFQIDVLTGSSVTRTISDGELTFDNSTGSTSEEHAKAFFPPGPHFAVLCRIESQSTGMSGGANAGLTLAKDVDNRISVISNEGSTQVDVVTEFAGSFSSTVVKNSLPSRPFDLYAIFAGNEVHVLTRELNAGWSYEGQASWSSIDLYDQATLNDWQLGITHRLGDGNNVVISDFAVYQTAQSGVRDPTIVTYRDGAPMIEDGKLYFTATIGMSGSESSYQGVFCVDVSSYEVEFTGALYSESVSGKSFNDHAGHLMYDENRDKWFIFFSGWGTMDNGPDSDLYSYVGESDNDLRFGVHTVETNRMNLPDGGTGIRYDPVVIYDGSKAAWRCIHNGDGITVSETADDSFTGGWSQLFNRQAAGIIEGGKITKIDGEYVTAYGDTNASSNLFSADYPDLSANRSDFDLDVDTGGAPPHPAIAPIYRYGETRYLMISFDGMQSFGNTGSRGALWIYEADQTATGYEFLLRSFFR